MEGTMKTAISLETPVWQYILNALGRCPHFEVHELMVDIKNQFDAVAAARAKAEEKNNEPSS